MIGTAIIALLASAQSSQDQLITVDIREPRTVEGYTESFRGSCDGRDTSVVIRKSYRGAEGGIIIRYGDMVRDVPAGFTNGLVLRNTAYQGALVCDGRRVTFIVHALQVRNQPSTRYYTQSATLDVRTGEVSVSDLQTQAPEEFGALVQ